MMAQSAKWPKLHVRPSNIVGAGEGVFAGEFIVAGTTVCEYDGPRCSPAEDTSDKSRTYQIDADTVIIGTNIGSKVNDCVDFRQLNYEETAAFFTKKILPNHHPHNCAYKTAGQQVFIVALRDLQVGEELYADYGFKYWAIRVLRNRFVDYSYPVSQFSF